MYTLCGGEKEIMMYPILKCRSSRFVCHASFYYKLSLDGSSDSKLLMEHPFC